MFHIIEGLAVRSADTPSWVFASNFHSASVEVTQDGESSLRVIDERTSEVARVNLSSDGKKVRAGSACTKKAAAMIAAALGLQADEYGEEDLSQIERES